MNLKSSPIRAFVALATGLALSLALAVPVVAQSDREPIPYVDDQGTRLGTILVREFVDPYIEFEPASPPAEGQRYALATLMFEAAEDQAFPADPYQVQLQDARGHIYGSSRVPRPADSIMPDLQGQTLAPFDRISGIVPFVLPSEAQIVRILYRGNGQRFMPVMELGGVDEPAVGEPSVVSSGEGVALGEVTVREVLDPFTEYDPNGPPPEGHRYVVLDTAFSAAEDQAMQASPSHVYLVGDAGTMYRPTSVPRVQPYLLQYVEPQPLSPGDRVSGVIGYAVPQDVVLDAVVYSPQHDLFLTLTDLQP